MDVQSAAEQRELELEFRELVANALEERWKAEGRYSAKEILVDVRANGEIWQKMMELLAQQAAVVAIRREMARRDPGVHPSQENTSRSIDNVQRQRRLDPPIDGRRVHVVLELVRASLQGAS